MADNRDDTFRVRTGRSRSGGRQRSVRPQSFIAQVNLAVRRAGGNPNQVGSLSTSGSGRFNARGRGGKIVGSFAKGGGWSRDSDGIAFRSRRVVVRARVVKLNPQRRSSFAKMRSTVGKAVDAHLRYLERDGVTQDGDRGQAYSSFENEADGQAFVERGREDRHQFRFIVAPEDASDLDNLRGFTRDLMRRVEKDLDTKLDWVAVDHHNTGHPHTHILIRGMTDDGKILNIAGDYIAHGIRHRASELMNLELGPQTELDVARKLVSDVDADRLTRLDRMLMAEQRQQGVIDLRPGGENSFLTKDNRHLLIGRVNYLERFGLASEAEPGRWIIAERAEGVLKELGERDDAIKTMHRALKAHGIAEEHGPGDYLIHGGNVQAQMVGRVLAKGLAADEMGDKVYLVIDGVDGRIHHIESDPIRVDSIGKGMIVEIAPTAPKAADRNILEQADANGIYRPSQHLEAISAKISRSGGDPSAFVASHIRRLEALRREGHVERIDDDHWRIPANLPERGMTYDAARGGTGPSIRTLSTLTLERQINSDGATWLDRELASSKRLSLAKTGFGQRVTIAMDARRQSLVDQGHATWLPKGKIWTSKSLIANLEKAELSRVGQELATKRGMTFVPSRSGEYVSGTLQGSTNLASGRFAMIETVIGNGGLGFQLVPWQPVLEQHLGRHISGVARDSGGIDWSFGRKRGLGI